MTLLLLLKNNTNTIPPQISQELMKQARKWASSYLNIGNILDVIKKYQKEKNDSL